MPSAKDCHTLTSYYEKIYKDKYGTAPVVNRNTARWSFDSILHSLSIEEAKNLLDFYFETESPNRHALQWFFFNYEKLIKGQQDGIEDADHRQRLRRESEERAKEWRERFGNKGITSN